MTKATSGSIDDRDVVRVDVLDNPSESAETPMRPEIAGSRAEGLTHEWELLEMVGIDAKSLTTNDVQVIFDAIEIIRIRRKQVVGSRIDSSLVLIDPIDDKEAADILARAALESDFQPESEPGSQPNRPSLGASLYRRDAALFSYTAGVLGAAAFMALAVGPGWLGFLSVYLPASILVAWAGTGHD